MTDPPLEHLKAPKNLGKKPKASRDSRVPELVVQWLSFGDHLAQVRSGFPQDLAREFHQLVTKETDLDWTINFCKGFVVGILDKYNKQQNGLRVPVNERLDQNLMQKLTIIHQNLLKTI